MRLLALLLLAGITVSGITVRQASFSLDVNEQACAVRKPTTIFNTTDRQIFFALHAGAVAAGEQLRLEWIDPAGAVADSTAYRDLPASPELCFITQLPVAGFDASSQPGNWSLRVVANDREIGRYPFQITGASASRVHIGSVAMQASGKETVLVLDGSGFDGSSVTHVAEFKREGGWRYIHSLLPAAATATRLSLRLPALEPGEYLAIIRNGDDSLSAPARFVVTSGGGYQLPIVAGERWIITQGPYGGFSHWNHSLHAYDIAPINAKWVAAMRGGIAYTHDVGAVQSHTLRTFGNYITIQHDDGDFSHYAHLATGTFLVKNGQRVEAGQPLAHVGNSGYTLGEGGGYHVHVHVTKTIPASAQSIPFRFSEFPDIAATALKNREIVGRTSASVRTFSTVPVATRPAGPGHKGTAGSVAIAGIWSDVLNVPAGTKSLELTLSWNRPDQDLDLRVVSPSGRQYGALGESKGYSGPQTNPERLQLDSPEPGTWHISVAGMKGGGEAVNFVLDSQLSPAGQINSTARRAPRVPQRVLLF